MQLLPQSSFSQLQVCTQLLHVQMRYFYGAHENTVQDQVLPPFVDLSPEFVDLFAGCFDLSHLVAVEIVYLPAGVVDVSAGCFDLSHLVDAGVVDLSAGVVDLSAGVVDLSAGVVDLSAGVVDFSAGVFHL